MSKREATAVYAGSFDPLTLGHLDVIERASKIFSRVIVGIGVNRNKPGFIPLKDRKKLIEECVKKFSGVEVLDFESLTTDFAKEKSARVLVRGLRTEADFTVEMQMATMNRALSSEIETIFIPTRSEYAHVSSSLVREVHGFGGEIQSLVPRVVYEYLKKNAKK